MSNTVIKAAFGESAEAAIETYDVSRGDVMNATESKGQRIALWIARLTAAGIMIAGALPKFFNFTPTGSQPLAEALGVGRGVITAMGIVEAVAGILLLVTLTRSVGALMTVGTMVGALLAHATVVGFSGSPAADMWPLAIVALAASGFALMKTRTELPIIGDKI